MEASRLRLKRGCPPADSRVIPGRGECRKCQGLGSPCKTNQPAAEQGLLGESDWDFDGGFLDVRPEPLEPG
eukprot:6668393-Alexandrium_andersonii.AAC.1